jgi:hypothetical protein
MMLLSTTDGLRRDHGKGRPLRQKATRTTARLNITPESHKNLILKQLNNLKTTILNNLNPDDLNTAHGHALQQARSLPGSA